MRTLWNCDGGTCPQLDERDDGDYEVQGYVINPDDKLSTPAGHDRILIPRDTLISMARQLLNKVA